MFFNQKTLSVYSDGASSPTANFQTALKEVKAFIRVDNDEEDDLIMELIGAAIKGIQTHTRGAVLNATYELSLDRPAAGGQDNIDNLGAGMHTVSRPHVLGQSGYIDLPLRPLVSVTSVTSYDPANAATVMDNTTYSLNLSSGRIFLNQGITWPVDLRDRAAIVIRFVAGYGATFSDLPVDLRLAIKGYVGAMYDSRTMLTVPDSVKKSISSYVNYDGLAAI